METTEILDHIAPFVSLTERVPLSSIVLLERVFVLISAREKIRMIDSPWSQNFSRKSKYSASFVWRIWATIKNLPWNSRSNPSAQLRCSDRLGNPFSLRSFTSWVLLPYEGNFVLSVDLISPFFGRSGNRIKRISQIVTCPTYLERLHSLWVSSMDSPMASPTASSTASSMDSPMVSPTASLTDHLWRRARNRWNFWHLPKIRNGTQLLLGALSLQGFNKIIPLTFLPRFWKQESCASKVFPVKAVGSSSSRTEGREESWEFAVLSNSERDSTSTVSYSASK